MTFDTDVVNSGRAAVVQVRGELDLSIAPGLDEQLVSLADEGVLDVTVDDSSGLQALVAGLKRLRAQGGDLGLRSPTPSTRKVLDITGLTSVFRVEAIKRAGFMDAPPGRATLPTGQITGDRSQVAVD